MAEHPQFHMIQTKLNVPVPLLFLVDGRPPSPCLPSRQVGGPYGVAYRQGCQKRPRGPPVAQERKAPAMCVNISQGCVWNIYALLLFSYYLVV